ncbi:MAG: single-stranded DNA-binding protein [Candidatus Margulisbacteria bacterium]|nr:single-stranded DNA-binding protein [Candidatus Margulisiibacteriota bacterium]
MYNKVFIIGRLTRDPETRYTPSGIAVCRFTVAVSRNTRANSNGQNETDFLRVVAWRRLGEICGEYLKKGRLIAIEGRLQISTWEKNGEKMKNAEIVADNMQMLERKRDTVPAANSTSIPSEQVTAPATGDIPF